MNEEFDPDVHYFELTKKELQEKLDLRSKLESRLTATSDILKQEEIRQQIKDLGRLIDECREKHDALRDKCTGVPIQTQNAYLDYIIRRNEYMDPRGVMQTTRSAVLKLDEVYVSLKAERQAERRWIADRFGREGNDFEAELRTDWERRAEEQFRRMTQERRTESVELPQAMRTNPRMVLLGDPGSGKTTLMRFLALHFARATQQGETTVRDHDNAEYGDARLPIFIPISQYADALKEKKTLSLLQFLPQAFNALNLEAGKLERLFCDALRGKRALVLLDGLDEVIDPGDRAQIARRIDEFVIANPGNRFLVTSRIAGYRIAPLGGEFTEFTLQDLEPLQVSRFLSRWCAAYERFLTPEAPETEIQQRAQTEATEIEGALKENLGVQRLAKNPLLLTILCLIRRNATHLPHRRVELYEIATQTLLRDWQLHRGIPGVKCVEEGEALRLLGPLALWLHEEKPTGMASKRDVEQRLAELLAKERGKEPDSAEVEKAVEDFLIRVREHTGLFVERAPGYFGFMHLTFEEYFVGRELVRRYRTTAKEIYRYRHLPRWEEPILLAIGYESKSRPEYAGDLIRTAILAEGEDAQEQGFTPSHYEETLHRDLLFAAHCLGDCAGADSHLIRGIVSRLINLYCDTEGAGRYKPLRDRILARLHYLRHSEGGQEAIQLLLKALGDKIVGVRQYAALALWQLGQVSAEVVNTLLKALKDENLYVWWTAMEALGQSGQASTEVVSALLKALEDENLHVRRFAAETLKQLNQVSAEVVSALLKALEDKDWVVVRTAASVLVQSGQASAEVVSTLLKMLEKEHVLMRVIAASALGQLGQVPVVELVSVLLKVLRDEDWGVRRDAAEALSQLGQASAELVSTLLKALENEDWRARLSAVSALGQLGQGSTEVVSALLKALEDENLYVRWSATEALGQSGQASTEVVSALLKALEDENIGRAGVLPHPPPIFPNYLRINKHVRGFAAEALGQLGQASSEVMYALLKALRDKDEGVRRHAASALGLLGQTSAEVVNALLKMLGDDRDVRSSAASALGRLFTRRIGLSAFSRVMSVLEALEAALADPLNAVKTHASDYPYVYDAVWEALWQVSARVEESVASPLQ